MQMATLSKISLAAGLLLVMGVCWTISSNAADADTASEGDVSSTLVIELDGNTEDDTESRTTWIITAPEPEQTEPEVTELEGTWEFVSSVAEGRRSEFGRHRFLQFKGNGIYIGGIVCEGPFSVDPSGMPAEIDLIDGFPGTTDFIDASLGIYEIDGDLLRICFGISGSFESGVRPNRFNSSADYPTWLATYRRVTDMADEQNLRQFEVTDLNGTRDVKSCMDCHVAR